MPGQVLPPFKNAGAPLTMVPDILMHTLDMASKVGFVGVHFMTSNTSEPRCVPTFRHNYNVKRPDKNEKK